MNRYQAACFVKLANLPCDVYCHTVEWDESECYALIRECDTPERADELVEFLNQLLITASEAEKHPMGRFGRPFLVVPGPEAA